MGLKNVSYTDSEGRKKAVLLPEDALEEEAELGIPLGPPNLESLNLPPEIEIRLNNELFNRGIITPNDAIKNRKGIFEAIVSVFKIDGERILAVYMGEDFRNANQEPAEDVPNKTMAYRRPRQSREPT